MAEQEKLERAIRVLEGNYRNFVLRYNKELVTVNEILALLKAQEPHKKGYWIYPLSTDCICSVCGNQPEHEPGGSVPLYDYCPYCGVEMEVKWNG